MEPIDLSRSVRVIKEQLLGEVLTEAFLASLHRKESAGKNRKTLLDWINKQQKSLAADAFKSDQMMPIKPEPRSVATVGALPLKRRKRSRRQVKPEPVDCKKAKRDHKKAKHNHKNVKHETRKVVEVARSKASSEPFEIASIPSAQCLNCTCRASEETVARALRIAKSAPSYGSAVMVSRGPLKDEIFQRFTQRIMPIKIN